MTWNQAEQFCQNFTVPSLGYGSSLGHLISIHTQAEQDFAITLYETSRKKDNGVSNPANLLFILTASSFPYNNNNIPHL